MVASGLGSRRQQTKVADAVLVRLPNMLDQTIEELLSGDGGLVDPIIVQLVAVAKPHMMGVKLQDAAIGDGQPPDVAGDVGQKLVLVRTAMFRYVPEDYPLIVDVLEQLLLSQIRAEPALAHLQFQSIE